MGHFPSLFEGNYEYLLREVLESIDDAVLVFDSQETIIYANEAANSVFVGDKKLVGMSVKQLIPKDNERTFKNIIAELNASQHREVELQHKREFVGLRTNGHVFYAEGKLANLKQDLPYILILRDITWRKAVEGELKTALGHLNNLGSKIEYRFEHPAFLETAEGGERKIVEAITKEDDDISSRSS